jgi:hypothetical protein
VAWIASPKSLRLPLGGGTLMPGTRKGNDLLVVFIGLESGLS